MVREEHQAEEIKAGKISHMRLSHQRLIDVLANLVLSFPEEGNIINDSFIVPTR